MFSLCLHLIYYTIHNLQAPTIFILFTMYVFSICSLCALTVFILFITVSVFRVAHRATALHSDKAVESLLS